MSTQALEEKAYFSVGRPEGLAGFLGSLGYTVVTTNSRKKAPWSAERSSRELRKSWCRMKKNLRTKELTFKKTELPARASPQCFYAVLEHCGIQDSKGKNELYKAF